MISLFNKLRFLFLKPDSRLELWLRTQYHRLMASRLAFKIQDWLARRSYQRWREKHSEKQYMEGKTPSKGPIVSFLLTWDDLFGPACLNTIDSIQNLANQTWDIILFVAKAGQNLNLPQHITADDRIQVISAREGFDLKGLLGQFILICQPGDQFKPDLLQYFYESLDDEKPADLTYYDGETLDDATGNFQPHFKPTGLSPELMLSVNYLSRGIIKRDMAVEILGEFDPHKDLQTQEYELNLKMIEREFRFRHIPEVLVTQLGLVKPDHAERQTIFQEHLARQGLRKVASVEKPSRVRFTWDIGNPSLTLVILTKNHQAMLETLLTSIMADLRRYNAKINIVDNGSDDAATLAYYRKLRQEPNITIIQYDQPFNYSEAINLGVRASSSDLVLLLNDDMQRKDPNWLEELMGWAVRPQVGVVGTKLLRANHTIQHAGIIMGLSGFAGHIYLNAPEHYQGLFGSVDWYRDTLALTGACQMVRRTVFDEVGGYDEGYQLAFGDLDFCLQVHERGYRNVYTPFASMYHFEGQTRGYVTPKADVIRGLDEMQKYLVEGDPYFSPNLTYTRIPKCAFNVSSQQARLNQIESRRKFFNN